MFWPVTRPAVMSIPVVYFCLIHLTLYHSHAACQCHPTGWLAARRVVRASLMINALKSIRKHSAKPTTAWDAHDLSPAAGRTLQSGPQIGSLKAGGVRDEQQQQSATVVALDGSESRASTLRCISPPVDGQCDAALEVLDVGGWSPDWDDLRVLEASVAMASAGLRSIKGTRLVWAAMAGSTRRFVPHAAPSARHHIAWPPCTPPSTIVENALPAVRPQCKVLYVGKYSFP